MRILVANWSRAVAGGAETYLRGLLPLLCAREHQVGFLHEVEVSPGRPAVDDALPGGPRWQVGPADRESALRGVADWAPQVAFLHGLLDPSLEAALAARYPTVLFAHNYYGTCLSGSKSHAFPARRPCGRTFGPLCLFLHYARRCGGLDPGTTWNQYRLQTARRALVLRHRAVLVASNHMRREYLRHGVPAGRLHCVPYFPTGTSPDPEPPAPRAPAGRILTVGRLVEDKGVQMLLPAVARARRDLGRPLTLLAAGDGPERPRLERLARRLNVPVAFLGWVNDARRNALMREADLLAVPSLWPEPFGLVGIEAGCVGLPTAAYATGGVSDWLTPGVTGESAPGDAPTAAGFAGAIVRALSDPGHWADLRRGAWEKARQFTPERHVTRLEQVLAQAAHE